MGFMANRLNVSITGLQASSGIYYVPKWTEFAATLMVLTAVVMAFRYAVIYLDILPKNSTDAVDGWGGSGVGWLLAGGWWLVANFGRGLDGRALCFFVDWRRVVPEGTLLRFVAFSPHLRAGLASGVPAGL